MGRGAISQLPLEVLTPTPGRAVRKHRTGVDGSGGHGQGRSRELGDPGGGAAVLGGPIAKLPEAVVPPTMDVASADPAGVAGPGGQALERALGPGGRHPVHTRSVPDLSLGVGAPADGLASGRDPAGVVPPRHQLPERVATRHGRRLEVVLASTIPELAVGVATPARSLASSRQPTGMGKSGRHSGEAGVGCHGGCGPAVLGRAVSQLSGLVGSPAPGSSGDVQTATMGDSSRQGHQSGQRAVSALTPVIGPPAPGGPPHQVAGVASSQGEGPCYHRHGAGPESARRRGRLRRSLCGLGRWGGCRRRLSLGRSLGRCLEGE